MRIALIVLLVFLAGCLQSGPRCSPPYLEYSMGYCCLDANQNNVCDRYERGASGNASTQQPGSSASPKSNMPTTLP
jgi:hypothetical protein